MPGHYRSKIFYTLACLFNFKLITGIHVRLACIALTSINQRQLQAIWSCIVILFFIDIHILCRVSWLEISGTHYASGSVVVISIDFTMPVFAIITDILVQAVDEFYFACKTLETACFVPHYHSYGVGYKSPAETVICKQSSLIDHNVLGLYKVNSRSYVSLKYHLIEQHC